MMATKSKNLVALATLAVIVSGLAGMLWLVYRLPATVGALVAGAVGFLASKFYESLKDSKQRCTTRSERCMRNYSRQY